MATAELDRGNGEGHGGPARGYRWADAERGNLLAVTHGFHIDPTLRAEHRAELDEIGATVWGLLPVKRPELRLVVEQVSVKLWRQRRAYRDLSEHGLIREGGKPAPLLAEVAKVENAIQRDLVELGLTPRSAAALGVDLVAAQRIGSGLVERYGGRVA